MARTDRVVAELGRPETPDETAARKAESSRIYRSSQTFRNLLAALIATLVVVAVVFFGVPRGEPVQPDKIDVAEVSDRLSTAYDRTVISPDVPDSWRVNAAQLEGDDVSAFTIVYAFGGTSALRVAQAFEPDPSWASRTLSGETPDGTETIDGITWDRYEIGDPSRAGNISYALSTTAGTDTVMIYGSTDADTAALAAASVADQIRELEEAAP